MNPLGFLLIILGVLIVIVAIKGSYPNVMASIKKL